MTDKMRKEFEVWWIQKGHPLTNDGEVYLNRCTHYAWLAWQASRESIKDEAPFEYQLLPSVESVVAEIKANVIEPRHSK